MFVPVSGIEHSVFIVMLVLSLVHKIHFRWYTKLVSSFTVTFLKDANIFVILIMIFFVKKMEFWFLSISSPVFFLCIFLSFPIDYETMYHKLKVDIINWIITIIFQYSSHA